MTNKRLLWVNCWAGSKEDFDSASTNSEFDWEYVSQWSDTVETIQHAQNNATPYAVAFVDTFEKAEWIWKFDSDIQCVISPDENWDTAKSAKRFEQWDKWMVMRRPFSTPEACQSAKLMCRKWALERENAKNNGAEKKVLIVDDEGQIREIVKEILKENGLTVYTAQSGKEALALLQDPTFAVDLMITDVVMPDVTGVYLARVVGQTFPKMPILFMSGYERDEQFQSTVENDERKFLPKPFNEESLCSAIKNALDAKSTAPDKKE